MHVRIKICGIKRPEIASYAIKFGADAIGLMFYEKSARYIDIDQAIKINAVAAPFVAQVGVVVNPSEKEIEDILHYIKLDYLQFHGDESPAFCAQFEIPYIKAIRVSAQSQSDLPQIEADYETAAGLMLDSYVSGVYGGTGEVFAWERALFGARKPIILAGGLNAENVQRAIDIAQPYCVDVSSGVETNGDKDLDKIAAFCSSVQQYRK